MEKQKTDFEKPPCTDFIIAAVRNMRVTSGVMKEGTQASVSLSRLSQRAFELYSPAEFIKAMNTLIKEGEIIVTADIRHVLVHEDKTESSNYNFRFVKVDAIPRGIKDFGSGWRIDDKKKLVDVSTPGSHTSFSYARVYVVRDGLPDKVKKLTPKIQNLSSVVVKILDSMKLLK